MKFKMEFEFFTFTEICSEDSSAFIYYFKYSYIPWNSTMTSFGDISYFKMENTNKILDFTYSSLQGITYNEGITAVSIFLLFHQLTYFFAIFYTHLFLIISKIMQAF